MSSKHPFIAATPDRLVSTTHVVEAKCPYSGQHAMTEPGLSLPFLELQHGRLTLKRCHKYFEQVQGQMAVTKQARAMSAPSNDLKLMQALTEYRHENSVVSEAAGSKFCGHLWYLSEELVGLGLAFYDSAG